MNWFKVSLSISTCAATQWCRKAAETGHHLMCLRLAEFMYADRPHAREAGHVDEAAGVATSAEVLEGHDVPLDVLTGAVHWLRNICMMKVPVPSDDSITYSISCELDRFRKEALVGADYCYNDGCEVVGHLKEFKVCPQCKTARYCGDACQKQDWNSGGHKATCGTFGCKSKLGT